MQKLNSTLVGDWINKSCGVPPESSMNSSARLNWKLLPEENFIDSSWAREKSEFTVLRVYFSEFNVIQSKESLVSHNVILASIFFNLKLIFL